MYLFFYQTGKDPPRDVTSFCLVFSFYMSNQREIQKANQVGRRNIEKPGGYVQKERKTETEGKEGRKKWGKQNVEKGMESSKRIGQDSERCQKIQKDRRRSKPKPKVKSREGRAGEQAGRERNIKRRKAGKEGTIRFIIKGYTFFLLNIFIDF